MAIVFAVLIMLIGVVKAVEQFTKRTPKEKAAPAATPAAAPAPAPAPAPTPTIVVGSKVKMKFGAKDYNGGSLASFVGVVKSIDEENQKLTVRYGFDVDGGSILARQLIDILKIQCNLTVVFIRKNREIYMDSLVREIKYVEYKNPFGNKFLRRLQNLDTNREAIGDYTKYDTIITAHVSKFPWRAYPCRLP